jgi:hypothetical protein
MVQLDAEFHFLQNGTTTTLYDALTPLPWPYSVFHLGYGASYFWSQLFNIGSTCTKGLRAPCPSLRGPCSLRLRWEFHIKNLHEKLCDLA